MLISRTAYYTRLPHVHARIKWTSKEAKTSIMAYNHRYRAHPKVFFLFSKLPVELRVMIWHYAITERVIELRSWGNTTHYAPIKYSVAPHQPPSLLHVNQESRREALRTYQLVNVGISTWAHYNPTVIHIPWRYHIQNPYYSTHWTLSDYHIRGFDPTFPMPYKPQRIFIDFSRDTIYLGPEFKLAHLESFLDTAGSFQELCGLQHLALDRKIWTSTQHHTFETLRRSLYSLIRRPLKTMFIVPDDEKYALNDCYYYHKHEISLERPDEEYIFWTPDTEQPARTVVDNLEDWLERLWQQKGRTVPRVEWKSVRRNGRRMNSFRDGAWEIQKRMGDMAAWSGWIPTLPVGP